MPWNPNVPTVTNRVQDDLDAIRENFQVLDAHLADTNNPHNVQAPQVPYSSGVVGFSPADVAAALDALAGVRIVEMGSNANGTYVRWENGVQVCFGWVAVFTGNDTSDPQSGSFTLPAAFSSNAALWAGNESDAWHIYLNTALAAVTTGFTWRAERKTGSWASSVAYPIHFIAIGRWK